MTKVLFVCLGNICRSPMAEAIFDAKCKQKGLKNMFSDSAGTASYHIGSKPDHRTIATVNRHDIPIEHRARQFVKEDYEDFDFILAMDGNNYDDIIDIAGSKHDNLYLLREFEQNPGSNLDVPDPYYGGINGFENIFHMMSQSIDNLIDEIQKSEQ